VATNVSPYELAFSMDVVTPMETLLQIPQNISNREISSFGEWRSRAKRWTSWILSGKDLFGLSEILMEELSNWKLQKEIPFLGLGI
jgi:hypothetical protein